MAAIGSPKGDHAKTLDDTRKHHSASIKFFISGTDNFVSLPTVTETVSFCKAYQPSLPFAKDLQKHYEVVIFSSPSIRCCKLCHHLLH